MIACLALVALVACSSNRAESAKASYEASFSSDTPDLLIVEVDDDQPVTAARLAASDGTFDEAYSIDTDRQSGGASPGILPSVGVGVSGGSSSHVSTGVGLSFPIFGASGPAPRPHYRSTARIRVTGYGRLSSELAENRGQAHHGRRLRRPSGGDRRAETAGEVIQHQFTPTYGSASTTSRRSGRNPSRPLIKSLRRFRPLSANCLKHSARCRTSASSKCSISSVAC